jgi:hypothetical protein
MDFGYFKNLKNHKLHERTTSLFGGCLIFFKKLKTIDFLINTFTIIILLNICSNNFVHACSS